MVPFAQSIGFPWLLGKLVINWGWCLVSPGFHQLHMGEMGQQMVRFVFYNHSCSQIEFFGAHVTIEKRMSGSFQIDMRPLRFLLELWAGFFWQKPSKVLLFYICRQIELLACHVSQESGVDGSLKGFVWH